MATKALKSTRIKNLSSGQRKSAKNSSSDGADLRQELMWDLFINRQSESWNNATKSAIKAGYSISTAKNITREIWFRNKIKNLSEMLPKAEEILWDDLNADVTDNINLRRIRSVTAIFICETLGKKSYHKKHLNDNNHSINLIEGNEAIDNLFRQSAPTLLNS